VNTLTSAQGSHPNELRFVSLFNAGRGYTFPCDDAGLVDMDSLSDKGRANYFYARTCIGREFRHPVVQPIEH
jgi:hypothetical protein